MSEYVIRPLRKADFPQVITLRAGAGAGFTSLAVPIEALEERIQRSEAYFASPIQEPGEQRYLLGLEHRASKAIVGMAGVKAQVGLSQPFYNFRILRISQASAAAQRRFDMEVLILVNEFTGASEVGTLFVLPEHRGGAGRALAQSRYMLIALERQRFSEQVVSELRGHVEADGTSPFWEGLGRHFFRMDFAQADRLSATTDSQFILDLMPKYPIYVDFLPPQARAAIGICHREGEAARYLLEQEGFRYDRVVDIFDGGPLLSTARDALRTVREARRVLVKISEAAEGRRALIAVPSFENFRCIAAQARILDGEVLIARASAKALGVRSGDEVLAWVGAA